MHLYSEALHFGDWRSHLRRPFQSAWLRTAKLGPQPQEAADEQPGWFWRTAQGKAFLDSTNMRTSPDLDDPMIGDQREED